MKGKNIVVIRGNVTRKPELRYTPDKIAVATYTIAESFSYLTKDNEWEDGVNFIDVAAFGKVAERVVKSLDKGYAVECEGKLRPRTIQDKQSGKKYKTNDVIIHAFTVLAKPRTDAQTETLYTKPSDDTQETEELENEEESADDDYTDDNSTVYADDETFDEFISQYSLDEQKLDIAARNPAFYI